jgi:hypothetical protein
VKADLQLWFASVDPEYFDDGIMFALARDRAEASKLLKASGCEGQPKQVPDVFGDGEPRTFAAD